MQLWETGTITVIEMVEEQRCKLIMPLNTFQYIMLSALTRMNNTLSSKATEIQGQLACDPYSCKGPDWSCEPPFSQGVPDKHT